MNGWIKLHRKILNWEWADDPHTLALWIHILASANHTARKWRGISIQPGQLITGRKALAEKTGLSERQVRTCLKRLEDSGNLTSQPTNRFTRITVVNWELYQSDDREATSRSTSKRPASDQPPTTNGEGKNGKKDNTRAHSSDANLKPDDVSQETWNDFLQIRQAKKKPLTQSAVRMLCTEAQKAGWSTESAVQEAAARGWQSFKASYVADQQTQQPAKRKNPQPSEWGLL